MNDDILSTEELLDLFENNDKQATLTVTVSDVKALSLLHQWMNGRIDPLPGVTCEQMHFRNFGTKEQDEQLVDGIVSRITTDITTELSKRIAGINTTTLSK